MAIGSMEAALAFAANASTGESPTWSAAEQALYWIDIEEPALHRLDPATGRDERWEMPAQIGAFALCQSGDVIVALRSGLAKVNLGERTFAPLSVPPANPLTHRFNDGRCDALGRFWVGTMLNPLSSPVPRREPIEADARPLAVYSHQFGLATQAPRAVIANGVAWSPDSRTMYFTDSYARMVWAFDFDLATATLSSQRVFAQFSESEGAPDGAAVDREGFYWCALYGGGRIVRLSPEGARVSEISLPVSQPTMCVFGGADFGTLFITSAAHGVSRTSEPLAGSIFCCRPGVHGCAPTLFADGE